MRRRLFRIENQSRGSVLGERVRRADTPWSRAIGLLGRGSLAPGGGLVLVPCNSVHMLFMRFAIDVLYVDKQDRVVKPVRNLKPFRVSGCLRGAHYTVELPAGTIDASGTEPGDQLVIVPVEATAAVPVA